VVESRLKENQSSCHKRRTGDNIEKHDEKMYCPKCDGIMEDFGEAHIDFGNSKWYPTTNFGIAVAKMWVCSRCKYMEFYYLERYSRSSG